MTGRGTGPGHGRAARGGGRDVADPLALAGARLLRTYDGVEPTQAVLDSVSRGLAAGVTLFRAANVGSPAQVRAACAALQAARPPGDPPLVIGLDQEGGQLQAIGHGATAWPGNLALGATGSERLAEAAGAAIGSEAAAMGATLVFAPVCDVLRPASATPLGTRSFGSDPTRVAALAAAMVRGLQGAGVAAVLKHFPGHGAARGDSHESMPVIRDDGAVIRARDFAPFRSGIAAGALAVLPGHLAAPALSSGRVEPATTSRAMLRDALRGELGFAGVIVSDAMNMGGAGDAAALGETAVAAVGAGIDLLLMAHDREAETATLRALAEAIRSGRLDRPAAEAAAARVREFRRRLGDGAQPPLGTVASDAHLALARRIAEASVTLVRDPAGRLPLWPGRGRTVCVLSPSPVDLTPAETSSHLRFALAAALRERGVPASDLVVPLRPTPAEVAALAAAASTADMAIAGTWDAVSHPGQASLVEALARRVPTLAVALRSPYDVALYPVAAAAACTYGIQPPQVEALADAIVGRIPFAGSLPVDAGRPGGAATSGDGPLPTGARPR